MAESIKKSSVKTVLNVTLIFLIGVIGIVFSALYFDSFESGFVAEYRTLLTVASSSIISVISVLAVIMMQKNKLFVYKLCFITVVLIDAVLVVIYILSVTGFWDKFNSIEEFRAFIASFGNFAVIIFVFLQFAQVVFLPIPAFITVGAGVLLFGALKGAILSFVGIILGSVLAFFIGRIFGEKIVRWLVGKEALDKALKLVKGKDKVILTFMFLFPFFPDDVLCFVSGLSSMSVRFYLIMITVTRLITIFASSYSLNNSIIPYDTWWGILLWALIFVATIALALFVYKKGDKIERLVKRKHKNKENKSKN